MMLTALILRPWVTLMRARDTRPRVLADDMLVAAHGEDHLHSFKAAINETHVHLKAMGAKLAPDKSTNFSSHQEARDWLGNHAWKHTGGKIPVKMHAKNLGAHICLTNTWCNPTGRDRLRKATTSVKKAQHIRVHYVHKIQLIRANMLPMGFYGCEASELPDQELSQLRSASIDTISNGSPHRSNDLVFATAEGDDLDPEVQVFVRRIAAIRRVTATSPQAIRQIQK